MDWDKFEQEMHMANMPLDLLMNQEKLKEFEEMFGAHVSKLEQQLKKQKREVSDSESEIDSVRRRQQTLQEYLKFLEFGGHDFVKEIIKENHHVILNGAEKIIGYKICGKNVLLKRKGYKTCIKKFNHKGRCSNLKIKSRYD